MKMPKSELHTFAKQKLEERTEKRLAEQEALQRKSAETLELQELTKLPLNPRRAIRQPDNSLWEPKPQPGPDQSIDHAANRYNAFEEAEWAPRLAHTRELVEDLLPRLRGILDAHRAEPYTPAVIPDGPRETVRDAIIAELQKFESRYAAIIRELREHGQRSKDIKFVELSSLAKPFPMINLDAAVASWRQPMARLAALPSLPTAAAVDLTLAELRELPHKLTAWGDTLRMYRTQPENVFRTLGQLRRDIDSTIEGVNRNTEVRALTSWTLAVPLDPMAYGTPRIPVMPIVRDGQVEID
jgi:hypothetical protein